MLSKLLTKLSTSMTTVNQKCELAHWQYCLNWTFAFIYYISDYRDSLKTYDEMLMMCLFQHGKLWWNPTCCGWVESMAVGSRGVQSQSVLMSEPASPGDPALHLVLIKAGAVNCESSHHFPEITGPPNAQCSRAPGEDRPCFKNTHTVTK